ncbi:MAG TPA: GNAT family N-acetyltransferase [Herpetosiphonaceae bacterium]
MVQIREATEADIPQIVEVIRAAFAEYDGRLDPPSSAQARTVEATRRELARGSAIVALLDGAIVGCVFYFAYADHMYFSRLAVLSAYRGRGFARRLIVAVEDRSRVVGLSRVRLSVRLALPELRAAYERLGYTFLRYGTHEGYAEPTYVTLQKALA